MVKRTLHTGQDRLFQLKPSLKRSICSRNTARVWADGWPGSRDPNSGNTRTKVQVINPKDKVGDDEGVFMVSHPLPQASSENWMSVTPKDRRETKRNI